MDLRGTDNGGSLTDPAQVAAQASMIGVLEQSTGLTYRKWLRALLRDLLQQHGRPELRVPRGRHVRHRHARDQGGWNDTFGYLNALFYNFNPIGYTFLNSQPASLTETIMPYPTKQEENHDFGMFIQDNWKMNRNEHHRGDSLRLVQEAASPSSSSARAARSWGSPTATSRSRRRTT